MAGARPLERQGVAPADPADPHVHLRDPDLEAERQEPRDAGRDGGGLRRARPPEVHLEPDAVDRDAVVEESPEQDVHRVRLAPAFLGSCPQVRRKQVSRRPPSSAIASLTTSHEAMRPA